MNEVEIYLPNSENPEQQIQQNKCNNNTAAKRIRSTIMKYVTPQKSPSLVKTKLFSKIIWKNPLLSLLFDHRGIQCWNDFLKQLV